MEIHRRVVFFRLELEIRECVINEMVSDQSVVEPHDASVERHLQNNLCVKTASASTESADPDSTTWLEGAFVEPGRTNRTRF